MTRAGVHRSAAPLEADEHSQDDSERDVEPAAEPDAEANSEPHPERESAERAALALEDIVARVVPAVASIQAGPSRGTGFFVTPDTIITNAHVVGTHRVVRLQVGSATFVARVTSLSPGSDLAVLQVERPDPAQATLQLGSMKGARVGQDVIAVGSALGVLSNTVTRGIVSAIRQVGAVTLVQTDAAINPGNSGGPLVDRHGFVIGVNSMTLARQSGEGVAFAVAIDHATQLLESRQGLASSRTPLGGLQDMFGERAEPADPRARGTREYRAALESAARSADQVDEFWNRYASSCVTALRVAGDRPWFAVYLSDGITISQTSAWNCASWLQTLADHAAPVRARVEEATETARRAAVLPGTVRDLRRRLRLTWD
jgi:S1-C subfamily serine protease